VPASEKCEVLIRGFDKKRHFEGLQKCVIELQDFERRINHRMPPGAAIVEPYLAEMFKRCEECGGRILVAEIDGEVTAYVTILPKVTSEQVEDGDQEYGLISDLVVLEAYRGSGLGRKLLAAAEQYARSCKVKHLRIGVLAGNAAAENLYESAGFSPFYNELEKVIGRS
jgi:GNAT superfamily N-acetyltransferase